MKKFIRSLLSSLLLVSASALWAETMQFPFSFTPEDMILHSVENGEVAVLLKDGELGDANPGKPAIPTRTFSVRLPEGESLVDWSVEIGEPIRLATDCVPVHEQRPYVTDGSPIPDTPRDAAAYVSSEPFPAQRGELVSQGSMRGVGIASFRIAPVWYVASEKTLYGASSITVKITTAPLPRTTGIGGLPIPRSRIFEDAINSMVVNPDTRLLPQTTAVNRGGSGCQYLIVATSAFATLAQRLADFRHSFNGVTAEVVTTETISSGYSGSDLPAKIRACITDYVKNKGTEYVLLFGDDTVIPPRMVYFSASSSYDGNGPSDMFYADLDGTWNTGANPSSTDLTPDVIVGRIPLSDSAGLGRYVDKVISYEQSTTDDSDIVRKMFWGGYTLADDLLKTSSGWQNVAADSSYAKSSISGSITETFSDGLPEIPNRSAGQWVNDKEMWNRRFNNQYHRKYIPNMRSSFFLGSATSWDTSTVGDLKQDNNNFLAGLNRGFHQMYMDTHGSQASWRVEGTKNSSDGSGDYGQFEGAYAAALTNRVDFVYTESCWGSAYDMDATDSFMYAPCMSVGFLSARGGAVGFIGCTRYGWARRMRDYGGWTSQGWIDGAAKQFAKAFMNRVIVERDSTLGLAWFNHKVARVSACGSVGTDRWMMLGLDLHGDPLLTYHLPPSKDAEPRASMTAGLVTLLRDTPIATTQNSAVIRIAADEIPLGTSASVSVECSTSPSFTSPISKSITLSRSKNDYETTVTGLAAGTTYYVRGKMVIGGETKYSPFTMQFSTKASNGVAGVVRSGASGVPVAGVTVQAKSSSGTVTGTAVTDAYGQYQIVLPAGWSGTISALATSGVVSPSAASVTIVSGQITTINFSVDQVYFVKQGAPSGGDGSSWANAFPSLATAFDTVPAGATLWVAQGTYYPEGSYGRDNHFAPKDHVAVYGGFAGTESGLDQRDWIAHPTILSGDIGAKGTWTDNCYHVVRYNFGVRLDGLVIQDGYLDMEFVTGDSAYYYRGSAIGSPKSNPSPTNGSYLPEEPAGNLMIVEHCRITHNYGKPTGSITALYNGQLSVQFIAYRNCLIDNNEAPSAGELLKYCYLDHCTVTANTSYRNVAYDATIRNSIVYGNTYTETGSMVMTEAYGQSYGIAPVFFYWTNYGGDSGDFLTESCVRYSSNYPKALTWYKGDPGWVEDVSGFEYALAPSSYAADKGRELDWVDENTLDYLGHPRRYGTALDLGCCEASPNSAPGALKLGIRAGSTGPTLNTLTVQARVTDFGTNSTTQALSIEYSTSPEFASASTKSAGTASNTTNWLAAVTIGSLTANTTYYLRTIATVGGEKRTSATLTLTTLDYGVPTLTVSAGTTTRSTIPINWTLSALGDGNASATVYIDYGTSSSFGSTVTAKTGATSGSSGTVTLENLSAQKTYYVRARAVTDKNKTGTSSTITPKTADMGNPTGGSIAVGTVGQRQADVTWTVGTIGEGAASVDVYIEWSTDTSYSSSQKVKTGAAAGASGSYTITGLNPSTTYNVRVRIVNNGSKSVTQTSSFTTKQEMNPAATGSLGTPGYTSVPVTLNLTSFGGTLTSASVLLEAFTSSTYSGTPAATLTQDDVTSLGNLALNFGGLAMDTTYYIRATITNDEGGVIVLNLGSIKTGKVEDLPIGQGYWQPGFVMGYSLGAQGSSYTTTQVSGATYSSMTSKELVMRPESAFVRAQEGTSITINGHSYTTIVKSGNGKKDKNSIFCYEGEMWMEKNVQYYFASNMADIQTVSIDGSVVVTETNGGQLEPVTASYTPTTTGWHAFKVAHAAGGGYFGACDRCSPPSGSSMLVTSGPFWDDKIGIAWSTNITMSASYNRSMNDAQWAAQWTPLGDAGDRHLFRVRGTKPSLVSINASGAKFTSNGFTIPVQTDAVNAGCTLTLYYGNSGDAWYFENRWAGKKSVSVATGSVQTDMAVTGVTVGDGIWVSARLKSSDGSYDCWTDPVYCEKTGTVATPPTGTVAKSDVSFTTANVTATLTDKGSEASNSDVTITLVVSKNSNYSSPVFSGTVTTGTAKSLTGLEPNTTYYVKATFTGATSGSSDATASFKTLAYTAPSISSVSVGTPTTSSASVTVALGGWGNGSTGGTILVEALSGGTVKASANGTAAGAFTLSGLAAGTKYDVRVTVTGSNGQTATDTSKSFTTQSLTAPTGSVGSANVSFTTANVTATLSSKGSEASDADVTITLVVSKNADYSAPVFSGTVTSGTAKSLTGLSAGTKYYAKATFAGQISGSSTATTTFTTSSYTAPTLSAVSVGSVTKSGATVSVTVGGWGDGSDGGTVKVEVLSGLTVVGTKTGSATGSFAFTGLTAKTGYSVRVTLTGSNGLTASDATKTFTTLENVPPTGTVAASAVSYTTATVTATLSSRGDEAKDSDVSISLVVSKKADFSTEVFSGTVATKTLTGLEPNTTYYVKATFTGATSGSSDATASFTTLAAPFVTLSAATATVSEDGDSAVLSVTVEDTNVSGGQLVLTLNGATVKTWTLAKGAFSETVSVTPGSNNAFAFTASGSGVSETANGSFVAKTYVGWFDVRFGEDAFVAGADWIARSTDPSGGTFTASDEIGSTLVKGTDSYVQVGGEVVYTPSHASETDADVKIDGRVQVSFLEAAPEIPTGSKAAVCFIGGTPRVYSSQGWVALAGTVSEGAWLDYVFEFDYSSASAPRVRYTVGAATSEWLPITVATRDVVAVRFRSGSFGDFKAVYETAGGDDPIELVRPEFTTDGTGIGLADSTFSLTISNPVKGAYYTVFTATKLTDAFTAEAASVLFDSSEPTFTLTVDGSAPTKFAKIVISTTPFKAGDPFPAK